MVYQIPVVYSMYGRVDIEANSVEEAFEYANDHVDDLPLPENGDYLDGSYEIDDNGVVLDENGNVIW